VIAITLLYPNNVREEVVVAGVPRVGEHIRMSNASAASATLVVDYVLWIARGEGGGVAPSVIISVRPSANGPD
jgi:hypothetical protein